MVVKVGTRVVGSQWMKPSLLVLRLGAWMLSRVNVEITCDGKVVRIARPHVAVELKL
jgi:hypothetical protein